MNKLYFVNGLCLLMILCCATAAGQPLQTRYAVLQNNLQNLNPAAANHLAVTKNLEKRMLFLSGQSQMREIDGANTIDSYNLRAEFYNPDGNLLIGTGLDFQKVHINNSTRAGLNFAYKIDLGKKTRGARSRRPSTYQKANLLFLGLGFDANFLSTDVTAIRYAEPGTDFIPISSTSYVTVSGGVFYIYRGMRSNGRSRRFPEFYLGASWFASVANEAVPASSQFFFLGGMTVSGVKNPMHIEPNITVRYASYDGFIATNRLASPLVIDLGTRFRYDNGGKEGFFGSINYGFYHRLRLEAGISKKFSGRKPPANRPNRGSENVRNVPTAYLGINYEFQAGGGYRLSNILGLSLLMPIQVKQPRSNAGRRRNNN